MLEIQTFLRKHWSEIEDASDHNKYFSVHDVTQVQKLFNTESENRYEYGKIELKSNNVPFLDEECELDYFFSTIQFSKEEIYSGEPFVVDNSYFKLTFLHEPGGLLIKYKDQSIKVAPADFNEAFVKSATAYYSTLLKYRKEEQSNLSFLLENLKEWTFHI